MASEADFVNNNDGLDYIQLMFCERNTPYDDLSPAARRVLETDEIKRMDIRSHYEESCRIYPLLDLFEWSLKIIANQEGGNVEINFCRFYSDDYCRSNIDDSPPRASDIDNSPQRDNDNSSQCSYDTDDDLEQLFLESQDRHDPTTLELEGELDRLRITRLNKRKRTHHGS